MQPPTEASTPPSRFYLPQLDGLRFFAFLLVFAHHLRPPKHAGPLPDAAHGLLERLSAVGWCGVDLFLVLSAYLITTLLLLERRRHGSISLRDFYIRRSLRIWPLYFLALLCGFLLFPLYTKAFGGEAHVTMTSNHLVAYLTFLGNCSVGLFGYPNSPFLDHLWTISLEEQFYLLWPLLLVVLARRPGRMRSCLGALLCLSLFLRLGCVFAPFKAPFAWTNLLTRLDPLVLGSWLAIRAAGAVTPAPETPAPATPAPAKWTPRVQLALGLTLLGAASLVPELRADSLHTVWQFAATAAGFSFVLAAVLAPRATLLARLLSLPPLVWLGKLCYGLYVFHMFGLLVSHRLARGLEFSPGGYTEYAFRLVVGLGVTTLLSALSYRLFERRFLVLKERFTRVRSRVA